jgi:UTP-glucose-1-phosphate uridylyltransferase
MIESSKIAFINQPEPRGFGHAVLTGKLFVEGESFSNWRQGGYGIGVLYV